MGIRRSCPAPLHPEETTLPLRWATIGGVRIRDAEDDAWLDEPEAEELEPDLGPDERDMDLIDGSWEERYYSGRERPRDWTNIFLGIGLLVVLSMVLPAILVLTR